MMNHLLSSAVALAALAQAAEQDVCRALVMSGGGSNGAWEAGVIWGFVNYGQESDFTYDVVSGVSAGAMNTAAFAGWELGTEKEFAQYLSDKYKNLKTSDIYVDWPFGKVQGLTRKDGAVDNSPLLAWLQGIVTEYDGVKRRFTIAATNVNDGTYTEFTQKNLDWHLLPNAAVASSSIPGFFPPYHWDDVGIFMDGMAVYNINVEGAIRQCRDLVDDDSKVIVDVLVCNSPDEPDELTKTGHSWNNFFRNLGLNKYYHGTDSIATSIAAHPSLQWRYILNQKNGFTGLNEVNLDGDFTWSGQLAGRQDAQDALEGVLGANLRDIFREWTEADDTVRAAHGGNVGTFIIDKRKQASAATEPLLESN